MRIHLINLDRTPARLAAFRAANAHLAAVSRFAAVDGETVDRAAMESRGLFDPRTPYGAGAMGCALSHLSLWQTAARHDRALTVCEDDAVFHHRFEDLAPVLIEGLGAAWDIVVWGWNFDAPLIYEMIPGCSRCVAQFDQTAMRAGIASFQGHRVAPALYGLSLAFGSICYTVSAAGAGKLLRAALPIRPFNLRFPGLGTKIPNTGIDIVLASLYARLGASVCVPPLVITRNDHATSTVQGRHSDRAGR